MRDAKSNDAGPTGSTPNGAAETNPRARVDRNADLRHDVIPIVGADFHVVWTPEDGLVRAAGFATPDDPHADQLLERLRRADPPLAVRGIAEPVCWDDGLDDSDDSDDADDSNEADSSDGVDSGRGGETERTAETATVSGTREAAPAVIRALRAYAAGRLDALDAIPVAQPETPFRGEVWRALRRVAPGSPVTYTELAALAGRPSAVRAAASGCANNLVALIVPCHRIVRSDGGLGGYLFGTEIKERLLRHEDAQELGVSP